MSRTALHDAKTVEDVRGALQAGADVNAHDVFGRTALMIAAQEGGEHGAGMMRALMEHPDLAVNKQHKNMWGHSDHYVSLAKRGSARF